jgi:hypothetical protein
LIESVSLSTLALDTDPKVVPNQQQGAKPVLMHSADAKHSTATLNRAR